MLIQFILITISIVFFGFSVTAAYVEAQLSDLGIFLLMIGCVVFHAIFIYEQAKTIYEEFK